MYRRNLLYRNVLITPDEVIAKSSTSHTLDEANVRHAIEIAEERFIRPALCHDLYEAIIKEKNTEVTAVNIAGLQAQIDAAFAGTEPQVLVVGDIINASEFLSPAHRALWNTYLWKLTAECVRFVAMPEAYAQFTTQGIVKNNPTVPVMGGSGSDSVGIDLKDAKWLMDKWMQDRIDPLIEAMHAYLCRVKLAGYCKDCGDCTNDGADGIAFKRKSDFIFGIYDEEGGCGC